MDSKTSEARNAIQTALAALKRGDRESARRLAQEASVLAPEMEQPWLILAALSSPAESLVHIEKVLMINPDSQTAQHALEWVNRKLQTHPLSSEIVQALDQAADAAAAITSEPALEPVLLELSQAEPVPPLPEGRPEPRIETQPAEPALSDPAGLPAAPARQALKIPEKIHPTIKPAHLIDSPSRAVRRGKRSRLSPALLFLFTVLGLLVLAALAGLIFFRPQVDALLAKLFSKEGCTPALVVGTRTFGLRTIKTEEDGTLKFPKNHPEQAAWVKGTDSNTVFVLIQTTENLALVSSLKAGDSASVTWANCNSTEYSLALPVPGQLELPALLAQSVTGITLLLPEASGLSGFIIHGELQAETINTFNTPDASALQAEISLLETSTSPDGVALTVGISINNYGQVAATLTGSDVSLTPENGTASSPQISVPALPIQLEPGTTTTFYFTFLRPSTTTATLKVLSVEYELEGY